jgi:hypothetical protein
VGCANVELPVPVLERALHQQQWLAAYEQAMLLVEVGHDHQVEEPVLVFEQKKDDALGAARALSSDGESWDCDRCPMRKLGKLSTASDVTEGWSKLGNRVFPDGDTGRGIVGNQELPRIRYR